MRFVGMDIHRDFCDVAVYDNGKVESAGRVKSSPEEIDLFARSLDPDDHVAIESSGNALKIARVIEPHVAAVHVADTRNLHAITHAKVKNDRVDARRLAKLLASGMLPGTWLANEPTRVMRRLVSRRTQLTQQRVRAKNQVHAVLIRNLAGRPPASDLFGRRGRIWLAEVELPDDERATVASCLEESDFLSEQLRLVEERIAKRALGSNEIRRLMTIPGVDMVTAATLMACIGDIARFPSPRHLVGYVGLDPRVRQSGVMPARHGHISKQGSTSARHVLCEAARAAQRSPGPLRAFAQRVSARRGGNVATVALARKIAVLAWHMLTKEQDYLYERPALTFRKWRKVELTAGSAKRSNPGGRHGVGTPDNPAQWASERKQALATEGVYKETVASWKPQGPSRSRTVPLHGAT